MRLGHFLSALEHERLHAAIKAAEEGTSGDIVVFLTRRRERDPLPAAHAAFRKLRLESKTGFLIFLAPKSQTFAVLGSPALHAKVGQAWWHDLSALLTRHFKEGHYTEGLIEAVAEAGRALRTHFPATAVDRTGEKDIVEE